MSTIDIMFWLLIVLIAILAFTIESGLSARHRTLVLSSIMSATLAAVYMMFLVDDNSEFGSGGSTAKKEQEKQTIYVDKNGGGGNPMDNVDIVEREGPDEDPVSRYEDSPLLKKAGGFQDCPECPLMIMIPAGDFIIGSPADEANRRANEGPQKLIRFTRPYTISRYEIQYKEFAAFVLKSRYKVEATCASGSNSWKTAVLADKTDEKPTVTHPVVCLTWKDANAYAAWLSEKADRKYSLPSEAEWEYAARGGATSSYWTGDDIEPEDANFASVIKTTSPVGKFPENGFKLFDVAGNVWEMTDDCWSATLKNVPSSGVSERGKGDCTLSPIRGGGWNSSKPQVRSAYRRSYSRGQASNTVGFRLAREIK